MDTLATVRDNKAGWQGKKDMAGIRTWGGGNLVKMEIWEQSFRESHFFKYWTSTAQKWFPEIFQI